jgi:hypothetical protein
LISFLPTVSVSSPPEFLPHGALPLQRPRLILIRDGHRLADPQRAAVGLLCTGDHPEQRRLARAIRANHTHQPRAWQRKRQPIEQQRVAERLAQIVGNHHVVPQSRRRRDHDLVLHDSLEVRLTRQFLVALQPRLALGLPRARRHSHPLQFALQRALPRRRRLLLLRQTRPLLVEPRTVVPLPRNPAPAVQLQNPLRHVVQEVAVVRDRHDSARELREVPLQPEHALGVQVIRRLVEEEQVGLRQQHSAQCDAAPLASREMCHRTVRRRTTKRVHRQLQLVVQIPRVHRVNALLHARLLGEEFLHRRIVHRLGELRRDLVEAREQVARLLHAQLDVLAHGLRGVEFRLLREVADLGPRRRPRFAVELGIHSGHNAQQR